MKFRSSVYASLLTPLYNISEMDGSGGLFVEIVLLIYIFCGFAVMCDKYLIPSIDKMRERYNLSERLAGSTILALASSTGLIASNMNAVLMDRVDQIEIALTALLGAAVFQTTIAIAVGCFLLNKNYKISFTILVRDLIIYLIVLVLLYYFIEMKHITISKSIILFTLWICYMIYLILSANEEEEDSVMVILIRDENEGYISNNDSSLINTNRSRAFNTNENSNRSFKNVNESAHSGETHNSDDHSKIIQYEEEHNKLLEQPFNSHLHQLYLKKKKFIEHLEHPQSILFFLAKGLLKIFSKPWELLLSLLTPKSYDGYYLFIHFIVPSILIWNVSEIELFVLEKMMKRLNVSPNFLGLTITAWGNNAPDMFSVASAMSKGMVDLAINVTIASEVHNVLLGLSLPWIVYNLTMKKPLTLTSNNLYAFTLFFYCFFILLFLIVLKMNKLRFDKKFASFLLFTYFLFLVIIFFLTFCKN